ncbi:Mu transposase C-terminal domain-containing protein [Rhodospirillum centenum]|uniref:Phage transposase protein A n=1 Tax=Rhodospirillum centenum (strain ATCC 51521 / SW) TaxID=414684 RepID=B6ISS2_RHOCS|nr:Mu transposase C-terminal domain-containing protein [Rhodospirillum centenum]ACI98508.1 phage transposase protein A [Rhodospirillum centenum SW]
MKDWFTAAELADLQLPAIASTERGIRGQATRGGWESRQRAARGGGREYPLSALPEEARLELARRAAAEAGDYEKPTPPKRKSVGPAPQNVNVATMPEKHLAEMEAKAAVVRAFHAYRDTCGLGQEKARLEFCALYSERVIPVAPWVRDQVPQVSKNALRKWEKAMAEHGLAGLAPRYGNRAGTGILDTDQEMQTFVLGLLADAPHVSSALVYKGLKARFSDRELPSLRSVQRFMERWKERNKQLFEKVMNPDAWRSKYKAASGSRSEGIIRLNQVWEMDSTPADLLLADNQRHALIGIIDVYSRRLRLLVSRTSSAAAIASAFRASIMAWGVPESVRIDNGADYISRHMRRAYDALGVETDICPPFTPESKPHIERAFRTFSHDLLELQAGFIGHNVAERKAIEARKSFAQRLMTRGETVEMRMTPEELQKFCDQWCQDIYQHDQHGGLNNKTPFQMAAAWTAPIKRIENERALDVLLSPTAGDGWRVVTKKGIRIDGASFDHQFLGGMEGQRVQVLFDEADYGFVYVFDEAGEFVCKAMCPERVGVSRIDVAVARKARQNQVIAEGMKQLRKAKKDARTEDVVGDILMARAEEAGKLVTFPTRSEAHTTPALDQAARAGRVLPEPPPARTTADRERHLALVEELRTAPPPRDERAEKRARVERALEIEQRLEAGEAVDADDRRWFEGYRDHPEFQTQKEMIAEFGRMVI